MPRGFCGDGTRRVAWRRASACTGVQSIDLNGNNELVKIDLSTKETVWSKQTGVAPYGIAIARDKILVTNWGGNEPAAKIGATDDEPERLEMYRFGVETMEEHQIRVLTTSDMQRVADTARRELRV